MGRRYRGTGEFEEVIRRDNVNFHSDFRRFKALIDAKYFSQSSAK